MFTIHDKFTLSSNRQMKKKRERERIRGRRNKNEKKINRFGFKYLILNVVPAEKY